MPFLQLEKIFLIYVKTIVVLSFPWLADLFLLGLYFTIRATWIDRETGDYLFFKRYRRKTNREKN